MTARSKAWGYGRSLGRNAGSNPAVDMNVCLLCMLCVVYVDVSASGWSLVQRSSSESGLCKLVWRWNLDNKEALVHQGLLRRGWEMCLVPRHSSLTYSFFWDVTLRYWWPDVSKPHLFESLKPCTRPFCPSNYLILFTSIQIVFLLTPLFWAGTVMSVVSFLSATFKEAPFFRALCFVVSFLFCMLTHWLMPSLDLQLPMSQSTLVSFLCTQHACARSIMWPAYISVTSLGNWHNVLV